MGFDTVENAHKFLIISLSTLFFKFFLLTRYLFKNRPVKRIVGLNGKWFALNV